MQESRQFNTHVNLLHHSIIHWGKGGLGDSLCHIVPVPLCVGGGGAAWKSGEGCECGGVGEGVRDVSGEEWGGCERYECEGMWEGYECGRVWVIVEGSDNGKGCEGYECHLKVLLAGFSSHLFPPPLLVHNQSELLHGGQGAGARWV